MKITDMNIKQLANVGKRIPKSIGHSIKVLEDQKSTPSQRKRARMALVVANESRKALDTELARRRIGAPPLRDCTTFKKR